MQILVIRVDPLDDSGGRDDLCARMPGADPPVHGR